ncbi:hypothetical protein OFD71_30845, partial [Escherichia coli]|nr:hypothetical protein [Escherichia coli]
QYAESDSYQFRENYAPQLEAPNLEDVQRLLSQLESTNVVDELDIDDILEQNTIDIAIHAKSIQPDVEVAVESPIEVVEEIQEWVIEEPVSEVIQTEVAQVEAVEVVP